MSYKIKNTMPMHLLSCTMMKKNEEVNKLLMTIPQLQNLLCDKFVIKQIKKRIKERSDRLSYSTTQRSSEFAQFYSLNNSKLIWQDTFQNILDMENSNNLRHSIMKSLAISLQLYAKTYWLQSKSLRFLMRWLISSKSLTLCQ